MPADPARAVAGLGHLLIRSSSHEMQIYREIAAFHALRRPSRDHRPALDAGATERGASAIHASHWRNSNRTATVIRRKE